MHPIRVAVQLHPQQGAWRELRAAAVTADEMGYDIAYTWDHFFPLYGNRDGEHFECWTLLAAWAEATSRIELGPLVACIGYRNPHLLADIARTVDHVSGGRVILGLGAGWQRRDYDAYGYEFGTHGPAHRQPRPGDPRDPAAPARAQPAARPPDADPHRRHRGAKTLRLVAQYADGWHAAFPERPEELVPAVEALRGWCAEIGRDPHDIEWGVGVEPEDLDRFLREDAERYVELGLHAVHARVQRAGLDGRPGGGLAGLARRAKPVTSWRSRRVGSGHDRAPPAGPASCASRAPSSCAACAASRRRTPASASGR